MLTPSIPSQDSGTLELHVQDLAMAVVLGVSAGGDGRLTLWSAGCNACGTNLHLQFHRGHR